MKFKSAVFLVIAFLGHSIKSYFIHSHCSDHMQPCNLFASKSCCHLDQVCKPLGKGALQSDLRCVRNGFLGFNCESYYDCESVNNAECSKDGVCECIKNYTAIGKFNCLSPLDGFCSRDSDCVTDDAICLNFRCKINFVKVIKDFPILSDFCELDSDCDQVLHAKCSKITNKCVCRPNNIRVNSTTCMPTMYAFCWKDEPCITENSICINNTCDCIPGFKFIPKINKCVDTYIEMPCSKNDDCKKIKNTYCYENQKCLCNENSVMINETFCVPILKGNCKTDDDCSPKNSQCVKNQCQCKSHYLPVNNFLCKYDGLGKICESNLDCGRLNAECVDSHCTCWPDTLAVNETSCLSVIGGYCNRDDQCLPTNSYCNWNRCECKPKYLPNSIDRCIPEVTAIKCNNTQTCENMNHRECNSDNICVCKSNTISFGPTDCLPLIGGHCAKDSDCEIYNSFCVADKCQCKSPFIAISKNRCFQ